jgi:hypothetical protein
LDAVFSDFLEDSKFYKWRPLWVPGMNIEGTSFKILKM